MDRISRRLTNLKQNKISVSKVQPSLQTLREGDEILYHSKNKSLRRYRREGNILWYTSMIHDGNLDIDKNLTVKNNLTIGGNINANGNIVGDDSTDITNIESIYADHIRSDDDGANNYIDLNDNSMIFYSGHSTYDKFRITNAGAVFNEDSRDYDFRVESNGNQNMLFVDGGTNNVGIGTGTPDDVSNGVVLHVYGGLHGWVYADGTQDSGFKILDSGTMRWEIFNSTGDSDKLLIRDEDQNNGVYMLQDAGDWTATSDLNLKTDISSISDALSKVNSIRGVNYKWKRYKPDGDSPNPDRDRNRIGCIAQEINEVLPEAVDSTKDGEWGVSYTILIPLLIEAVKELSAEVDILKNQ